MASDISPVCQIRTIFHSSCPSLVRVPDLKPRFPSLLSRECSASPFAARFLTLETPSDGEGPSLLPALCLRHALLLLTHSLLPLAGLSTVQPCCLRGTSDSRGQHCPNCELCDAKSQRRGFTATHLRAIETGGRGELAGSTVVLRDPRIVLCLLREPHTAQA